MWEDLFDPAGSALVVSLFAGVTEKKRMKGEELSLLCAVCGIFWPLHDSKVPCSCGCSSAAVALLRDARYHAGWTSTDAYGSQSFSSVKLVSWC